MVDDLQQEQARPVSVSIIGKSAAVTTSDATAAPGAYIRWFADISRRDVATAGGKGANLGELALAGFPVPPGFVVSVVAYDRFADAGRLTQEIASRMAPTVARGRAIGSPPC